jgi:hypothetical protein
MIEQGRLADPVGSMDIDQTLLSSLAMPQRRDLLERYLDLLCSIDKS